MMRSKNWAVAGATVGLLALCAGHALADVEYRVLNGNVVESALESADDVDTFPVTLAEGAVLSLKAKGRVNGGRAALPLTVRVLDGDGNQVERAETKGKTTVLRRWAAPASANYRIEVTGDGLAFGTYSVVVKWRDPRGSKQTVEIPVDGGDVRFSAGARSIAALALKPAKGSSAVPTLVTVESADGEAFVADLSSPPDGVAVRKGVQLRPAAEYVLRIANSGAAGPVLAKIRLKPPKPVRQTVDLASIAGPGRRRRPGRRPG